MGKTELIYFVFIAVVVLALLFDLGLLSKKNKKISLKTALLQTLFWVVLSTAFCGFILVEDAGGQGRVDAISYLSAYFLEWSLSIDNIFVFIIIFSYFGVREKNYSRVLLIGILMAVVFRIIFISVGSVLVARFDWIMYFFGAFLLYTGIKLFSSNHEAEFDPSKSVIHKMIKRILPITHEEAGGNLTKRINGKLFFTNLAVVAIMLGFIDIIFALDSIPAVFSVIPDPNKKLLIYSSNIFAVLGLRSLFFLLQGAASKFDYLQQGIAIVLLFIGLKMMIPALSYLGADTAGFHMPEWISLAVIVCCIGGSIIYSVYNKKTTSLEDSEDPIPASDQ